MLKRIYYAPYDWITRRFTPRDRGAFAVWLGIIFVISIPLQYPHKNSVTLVWLLSEIALVVGQLGVVSAETPVQQDVDIDEVNINTE
jgi:hypothetical protein